MIEFRKSFSSFKKKKVMKETAKKAINKLPAKPKIKEKALENCERLKIEDAFA